VNIYFELENYSREMESRILMSMEAALSGHISYISNRINLLLNASNKNIEPGVLFLKDINSSKFIQDHLNQIKKNGFVVICTDEEAGIQYDDYKDFMKIRSITKFENVDIFICWGLRDKNILKYKFKKGNTKFLALGSVRFDLCKNNILKNKNFLSLKKKINNKYILVSSNISFPIGIRKLEDFINSRILENPFDLEFRENFFYDKFSRHTEKCYYFLKLIRKLAKKYKDKLIIIRPHPNEKVSTWEKILIHKYNNVKIIKSGFLAEYIFNAETTIHTSCTTGIESFIMRKPSISYIPENIKSSIDEGMSNSLSVQCKTEEEVINTIDNLDKIEIKTNQELDYRVMNSKFSKTYKQLDKMFNIVSKKNNFKSTNSDYFLRLNNKGIFGYLKYVSKRILFAILNIPLDKPNIIIKNPPNAYEKFPPLTHQKVNEIFSELKKIDKKYHDIKIKILNESTIKIFK